MSVFITENLYTLIFILAFLLVLSIRFLFWKKKPAPKDPFFSLGNFGISAFIAAPIWIILIVLLLVFRITETEILYSNKYTEQKTENIRVLIKDTVKIYENAGKPNYIGKQMTMENLKKSDTFVPLASFKKGGGFSGEEYILVNCKGKEFWILKKNTLSYFKYVYSTQLLDFEAKDEEENELFWKRAKIYGKMHEKFLGQDARNVIFNDTLISSRGGKGIEIKRKKDKEKYLFFISAPTSRGNSKNTIIKDLKGTDDYYTPENDITCAYFIQHGDFYREKSEK